LPLGETCTSSDACLVPPDSNYSTCGQGSIPSYSVHATSSADVVNYVKFATTYNLRIVIKNSESPRRLPCSPTRVAFHRFDFSVAGHDYAGRSSGKGGFGLWTHGMQGISRHQSFVPAGCSTTPHDAVTIAAGVQWSTAYQYADDNNILIIGGDSPNVGAAGGWIQGGGHSVLSQARGLGVDNVLQATVVTADGVERTVNECQYSDLFWWV
jgi:FAD/FMN-containing dehydrogenase